MPGGSSSGAGQSGGGHSSAYSALSASLASLKNRLNARGVTLSTGPDSAGGYSGGYPGGSNSYGATILADSGAQQQHQQHSGNSGPSQATYLSVSQHEPSSVSTYSTQSGQGNDNKTIVLAIPAKINFLTDGRSSSSPSSSSSSSSQHKQQQQQLIQQSAGEQQTRGAEYSTKQLSLVQADGSIDPTSQLVGASQDQEHHQLQQQQQQQPQQQYVIVNQSPSGSYGIEQATQYVTANLGNSVIPQAPGSIYPNIYSTIGGVKYIPTYQQQPPQLQLAQTVAPIAVQPAAIQKLYTGGAATVEAQQAAQEATPVLPSVGEQAQVQLAAGGRYCLDTCNPGDARWRKYSYTRYKTCCSRSSQYDPSSQFDFPSVDKVSETSAKYADDAYYNYLYRRSKTRRSRRSRQNHGATGSSSRYSTRHSSSPVAPGATEEDAPPAGELGDSGRSSGSRAHTSYEGSSYSKYYRSQRYPAAALDSQDDSQPGAGKYSSTTKERGGHRRGRARDLDAVEPVVSGAHEPSANDDEQPSVYSEQVGGKPAPTGYGSGEYSVADSGRYQGGGGSEEDDGRQAAVADELAEPESMPSRGLDGQDYTGEPAPDGSYDEADQPETTTHKYSAGSRRRKAGSRARGSRKLGSKDGGKQKKSRKNKYNPKQESHSAQSSQQINGTDYDSAQPGVEHQQYHHSDQSSHPNSSGSDEESSYSSKDSSSAPGDHGESDKESGNSYSNKYRASLNDSTVANLSKTTMHLKEILSILEKKAHLKLNETSSGQLQQQPTTSTPTPTTTAYSSLYPSSLLGSQYGGSLQSSLPSEYLTTDLSLKSPYRIETPSLTSSLTSPGLSLSPSAYGSLTSPDQYSPLSSYAGAHYGLASSKHIPLPSSHHQRKRRPSKNVRPYNNFMLTKPYGLGASSALLQAAAVAGKTPLSMGSPYYPSFQYNPHWYPRLNSAVTNPYPYRSISSKNPYSSLLNGPLSSKLAAAAATGQLYSDETRLHGLTSYDPLSNVASSLRPSTVMRLKNKPFMFPPQVLPIYTRHTILSPSEVKKR